MMDDKLLIIRLKCSDRQAFAELYGRYVGKIYNYVLSMTRNKVVTEDITQFCFMKLWERRESLRLDENVIAYLHAIARNQVYKEARRSLTAANYIEHLVNAGEVSSEATADEVNFKLLREEIARFVDTMPESRRLIYRMSTEGQMSNEEIARKLNISVSTVNTQIWRVTSALRKHLSKFICIFIWFV